MSSILIIDDDRSLCRSLQIQLQQLGHQVRFACLAEDGLALLSEATPDLVLLDLTLPDQSGLEVLQQILSVAPQLPTVMITGKQDMNATIEAMRLGAFDYLRKPFDLEDIELVLEKVEHSRRQSADSPGTLIQGESSAPREIIGASKAMMEIIKQIGLLSTRHVTVLISGESGTGKELVARALHEAGAGDKPFVALNCSAVVPTLFESELFGHEKGAFTGADSRRIGKLEQARDGTVFLDEVGDMPLDLQAKLLRALQEQEFERVGGSAAIPLQARMVAATNRPLADMVQDGTFREDLYYRLNVSPLHLPPLRERRQDIRLLAQHLLLKIARELHSPINAIAEKALARLEAYDWPGNIRELENALTRAIALARNTALTENDFAFLFASSEDVETETEIMTLREAEKMHVQKALRSTDWNITRTAKLLDISPTTLRKKIADYELKDVVSCITKR